MVRVTVTSAGQSTSLAITPSQSYYDGLSKQWAVSEDMINSEDYSSKHYAQESKNQAVFAENQAKIATQKAQELVDKGDEALSNISTQENLSKNSVKTEGDAQVARIKTETKNFATKAEAKYTAGSGIAINNNVISNTQSFAKWGNISGEITAQTDLVQYIKNNTPDINNYQINNPYSLFDCKFADHKLDNLSWLCSEGQYNNGSVYVASYNELLSEYNNSESIEKTENKITFKRTPKGYKIALASQKTTIDNLYSTTGVAWFYILDIENQQFILPRTKYGFSGTRNNVGDYIPESLPNIKGTFYSAKNETDAGTGCIKYIGDTGINAGSYAIYGRKVEFDASFYSSTYQDNAPVQERSTQMHLYFYVGDTLQNADLINIARLQEELVDRTTAAQAAHAAMPSDKYVDLTLGASGTTYTAPADGYFYLYRAITTAGFQAITNLSSGALSSEVRSHANGGLVRNFLPCKKNDSILIEFDGAYSSSVLRFIYAVGSEPTT